jgi:hypothetical protein
MMFTFGRLGFGESDAYRGVPEERIVQMLMLGGWAYEGDSPEAAKSTADALQAWTEIGLGFRRGADGGRLFDPVEVENFMKRAGLEDRHGFWVDRYVATGRRLVLDFAAETQGEAATGERKFVVNFTRSFNLRGIKSGSRLRLRVPLPWKGHHLRDLSVTPSVAEPNAEVEFQDGRLEARMVTRGEAEAGMGAKIKFTARREEEPPDRTLTELERELYLRPRDGWVVVTKRVSDLAHSLAGANVAPQEAVRSFWSFFNEELFCGAIHYDQVDPTAPGDWVLDAGWFDCQLGSALFVALCRARGIPARLLGGRVLYRLAPTNHYWAEAWMNDRGWIPFDFLSWDLSGGGRDGDWRDYFFGRLDFRMTTECLPRQFTGAMGIPIPKVWFLLRRAKAGGLETSLTDAGGVPVYTDTVRISS